MTDSETLETLNAKKTRASNIIRLNNSKEWERRDVCVTTISKLDVIKQNKGRFLNHDLVFC